MPRAFTNLTDFLEVNKLQIAAHVESTSSREGLWAIPEGREEAEEAALYEEEGDL
uniref:Uncharacterized protein n=1 Tax=Thermogemmatispora argillosa TaxID=2045280 RepID=A0A455SY25_9CHLR|nr:hypothetical protein KTA_02700 [Thermogemmatispora argillosa]